MKNTLGNYKDFNRAVMGQWVRVRGEQIHWDLWSLKPKTMSINYLCPTFHKHNPHVDTFQINNP